MDRKGQSFFEALAHGCRAVASRAKIIEQRDACAALAADFMTLAEQSGRSDPVWPAEPAGKM